MLDPTKRKKGEACKVFGGSDLSISYVSLYFRPASAAVVHPCMTNKHLSLRWARTRDVYLFEEVIHRLVVSNTPAPGLYKPIAGPYSRLRYRPSLLCNTFLLADYIIDRLPAVWDPLPRIMVHHRSASWLDGPSRPGPKKENVKILKDENLNSQPPLGLTVVMATKLAVDALAKYERKHVKALVLQMPEVYLKELPYLVFDELDKELFRGVLQKNVYLRWSSLPPYVHGKTSPAGHKNKRVTIELNKLVIQMRAPPAYVLASLIHHMAHAYFLVCCGSRKEDCDTGKDAVDHGLGFSSLTHKIMDVFLPTKSKHKFPDLFTCYSGDPSWTFASSRFSKKKHGRQNSSLCCWGLRGYPNKKTCEDYLKGLQEMSASQKKDTGKADKPTGSGEIEKGKEKEKGKEMEKETTANP